MKRIRRKEIRKTRRYYPWVIWGKGGCNPKQTNSEGERVNRSTREARRHIQVERHLVSRDRGRPDGSTKIAPPHHELKTGPQRCFNFSHLLQYYINSLSVKQCFKFMLCPQPSGYDSEKHIIARKNQCHQLVSGYYIIYHPKGFTLI